MIYDNEIYKLKNTFWNSVLAQREPIAKLYIKYL